MDLRKAQVATEYIIIAGIVMVFLIPLWTYMGGIRDQISIQMMISYAQNAADRLAETAELIYSQGPPAKISIKVYIPGNVEHVKIGNRTVSLGIRTIAGVSDVFARSRAEINGSLPASQGIYWITVEAQEGLVQIYPME